MTPGPKKKGGRYRNEDKPDGHKKGASHQKSEEAPKHIESASTEGTNTAEGDAVQAELHSKYKKGAITSNWNRYEEPVVSAHEDVRRGADFKVLLSYGGGVGSQMQLQEEKSWEHDKIDEKGLVLDLKHLINAYKCIPFHRQFDLPEDIFDYNQLARFQKCADNNRNIFKTASSDLSLPQSAENNDFELIAGDDVLLVVEDSTANPPSEYKIPMLPKQTETLIQSLTSCLSLKEGNETLPTSTEETKEVPSEPSHEDDLDFLLALSSAEPSAKCDDKDKVGVDEWLDSILDL